MGVTGGANRDDASSTGTLRLELAQQPQRRGIARAPPLGLPEAPVGIRVLRGVVRREEEGEVQLRQTGVAGSRAAEDRIRQRRGVRNPVRKRAAASTRSAPRSFAAAVVGSSSGAESAESSTRSGRRSAKRVIVEQRFEGSSLPAVEHLAHRGAERASHGPEVREELAALDGSGDLPARRERGHGTHRRPTRGRRGSCGGLGFRRDRLPGGCQRRREWEGDQGGEARDEQGVRAKGRPPRRQSPSASRSGGGGCDARSALPICCGGGSLSIQCPEPVRLLSRVLNEVHPAVGSTIDP